MAISSKDIETLWKKYQEDGCKRGVSVARFFESNGVSYHTFEKWYKKRFAQPDVVDCVVKETPDVVSKVTRHEHNECQLYVQRFDHNMSFVRLDFINDKPIYVLEYEYLVGLLTCPVIRKIGPIHLGYQEKVA